MRTRLSPFAAETIHRLALRENRSDQQMTDKVVMTGIRALGGGPAPAPAEVVEEGRAKGITLELPLPQHRMIRALANREGRSGRSMLREVVRVGLETITKAPVEADTPCR
jgi:hypothetical protein